MHHPTKFQAENPLKSLSGNVFRDGKTGGLTDRRTHETTTMPAGADGVRHQASSIWANVPRFQHRICTLKRICRHIGEIFITGCTGSCHFDNFQRSQRCKFCQNAEILYQYTQPCVSLGNLSQSHILGILWALQWRHNGHDCVSNHQPNHCLLNRLFWCRSKKASMLRVSVLCAGNSPVTGEFPAQMASNAEMVSIWWRHHGLAWLSFP